jgi:deazaflavin-dependent oxidoreductase (nitroreductase family)
LASPGLLPAGLIILETKGRKTGKPHTTPLMASRWPGGHLWVTTVLGRRSDWLRNAKADPSVRYWLGGRLREGHAITAVPGHPAPDLSELPEALRWPARKWFDATLFAGFGALIIAPSRDDDSSLP